MQDLFAVYFSIRRTAELFLEKGVGRWYLIALRVFCYRTFYGLRNDRIDITRPLEWTFQRE